MPKIVPTVEDNNDGMNDPSEKTQCNNLNKSQVIGDGFEGDRDLESQHSTCDYLHRKTGVRISEIICLVGWIVCGAVCIYYIYIEAIGYQDAVSNPSTSVSFIEQVPLHFPAVTICNWNAAYYCDYCTLTLRACTMVNATDGTIIDCPFNMTMTTIEQSGQFFTCYVFNNNTESPVSVSTTGYGGSMSLYFDVPHAPQDRDSRFGLQASFHEIGTVPPVFAETNFAVPFVDNFFSLTKIITNRLKETKEAPKNSVYWSSRASNVQLTQNSSTSVVVSFAYTTLNIKEITEIVSKTPLQLFGEIAGMLGTLMVSYQEMKDVLFVFTLFTFDLQII